MTSSSELLPPFSAVMLDRGGSCLARAAPSRLEVEEG